MLRSLIVLGSRGMLGQMVENYFSKKKFNVKVFNEKFTSNNILQYVDALNEIEDSIVINCIGRIKQKSEDPYGLFLSNTILPMELSRRLKSSHFIIHPSTDCVFNGISGAPYKIDDIHNANDIYGISKSLGEKAVLTRFNSLVIRVSIIGIDRFTDKGLLSWFLSQSKGSILNGYNNHFWNGITTLEWCKRVYNLIGDYENNNINNIVQLGTKPVYSKYEMLNLFREVFKLDIRINNYTDTNNINRTLLPSIYSSPLDIQLNELKAFCKDWIS